MLLNQYNILLLQIDEDSEELTQNMKFLTIDEETLYNYYVYRNHYYNKRFQNGNLIFSRDDLGEELFNEFEDEVNYGKNIFKSSRI